VRLVETREPPRARAAQDDTGNAPGMTDAMEILHVLPGRFRARVAELKGNPERARELEGSLRKIPAIHSARANPATGTLLVQYHTPEASSLADLLGPVLPAADADHLERLESAASAELARAVRTRDPAHDWAARIGELLAELDERIGRSAGGPDLRLLLPAALLVLGGGSQTASSMSSRRAAPRWYEFFWFCFHPHAPTHGRRARRDEQSSALPEPA
jgi:hypothetical protein